MSIDPCEIKVCLLCDKVPPNVTFAIKLEPININARLPQPLTSVNLIDGSQVLKVHTHSFSFISNTNSARVHYQSKLHVQTYFIYLPIKLKLVHKLLD